LSREFEFVVADFTENKHGVHCGSWRWASTASSKPLVESRLAFRRWSFAVTSTTPCAFMRARVDTPTRVSKEGTEMKLPVLTLRQPWAGLVVLGKKTVENRSWRPEFPLPFKLLIHAGKTTDPGYDGDKKLGLPS